VAELHTHFHLFVYGTLRSGGTANSMLAGCDLVGTGEIGGVLYDIDGQHPALVVYGSTPVQGEIWRCPVDLLATLDQYEQLETGLMRRIGATVRSVVDDRDVACWVYVAGPALSQKLVPARRVAAWPSA